MKIASYNIRKAVGTDRRRDPSRILRVLNALAADVVVLQEADKRLGRRPSAIPLNLLERETDYAPVHLARTDVSLGWHGNAILVRQGVAVEGAGHIDLPGLEPRGAVFARLPEIGITLVGTHLGLVRSWRLRQMGAIREALGQELDESLVIGDFNEWSISTGFEPWEPQFTLHAPGETYHARRPVAHLDRIAVGRGLRLIESGVDRSAEARRASDHLPIWVRVGRTGGAN